jgi:hypothetical protein
METSSAGCNVAQQHLGSLKCSCCLTLRCRTMRFATENAAPLTTPVTRVRAAKVPAPAPIAVKKGERSIAVAGAAAGWCRQGRVQLITDFELPFLFAVA